MRTFTRSQELLKRARAVVPGGMPAHQNPAMLVRDQSPCFIERAQGCRFWDVDGNEYIDYMCAYGPIILGYNHPAVEEAARGQAALGDCFNLPGPIWVDLAERMVGLIAAADWVTFGKNGSDACNHAVRVARCFTHRGKILMAAAAYHGIGSWCTPNPAGITGEERVQVLTFPYNDADFLQALLDEHKGEVAAVVVTPFRHEFGHDQEMPTPAFLEALKAGTSLEGPLLIVDDVRAGFRLHMRGSAEYIGLKPHLSCFSKAMANGYPLSACVGVKELKDAAASVFFTGSFFSGGVALAAALATLNEMERSKALDKTFRAGQMLKDGMEAQAKALGIGICYSGPVTIPFMTFKDDPDFIQAKTFCAAAYQEGVFFHPYHNWFVSAAHTDADIEETLTVTEKAFKAVKGAL